MLSEHGDGRFGDGRFDSGSAICSSLSKDMSLTRTIITLSRSPEREIKKTAFSSLNYLHLWNYYRHSCSNLKPGKYSWLSLSLCPFNKFVIFTSKLYLKIATSLPLPTSI